MIDYLRVIVIIAYAFFIVAFVVYSTIALNHLKTYGYVGDKCQLMRRIYIIISLAVGFGAILAFIIL